VSRIVRIADLEAHFSRQALYSVRDGAISYAALASRCDRLAAQLAPGELVFVACSNSVPSVTAYLSCLRVGAPVALFEASLHSDQFSNLIEEYRPTVVFVPSSKLASLGRDWRVVCEIEGQLLLRRFSGPVCQPHPDLALLLSTSGSTGSPKLVRISRSNLDSNAESIASYLGLSPDDRAITTLPMSYSYGLSIINSHLIQGASIALTEDGLLQRSFWNFLSDSNVTNFGGVPYTFQLLRRLNFSQMRIPTLRHITQAGGKLSPQDAMGFARHCSSRKVDFYTMYGQTEATARIAYLRPELVLSHAGSIGEAIPGGELWIEDEKGGKELRADTTGELVYKGPNVAMGYAEGWSDLSLGDHWRGVLRTGDLARRSADGHFTIIGRKSRFAKIFGHRVSLDEIEEIARLQGVECACLAGDECVELYVPRGVDVSLFRSRLSSLTGLHHSGFRWMSVQRLPRNSAGKILYSLLTTAVLSDA
jgi:long-chain acyl-CoA synthetase